MMVQKKHPNYLGSTNPRIGNIEYKAYLQSILAELKLL